MLRVGADGSKDEGEGAGHVGRIMVAQGGLACSLGPWPLWMAQSPVQNCGSVGTALDWDLISKSEL